MWRRRGVCASLDREARRWTHCISTCISACVSPSSHAFSVGDLVLGSEQEEDPEHRQVLDGIFFGIKEGSQELVIGTLAGCVVCRIVTRWPREDAADPVFHNSIRGTSWKLLSDDELREPREPREPLRIDVHPVHAHPSHVACTSEIQSSCPDTYTPGCIGCAAAMTQGPSRDHTEQCSARFIKAMSSDVALIVRVRDAHNPLRQNQT